MTKLYKVGALGRYFTFFLGVLLVAYSCYIIFARLTADAPILMKFIPFAILFFAINSVIKNFLGLNKLMISENELTLFFLFGREKAIPYQQMESLILGPETSRIKKIMLGYHENGRQKILIIPKNIQNILEFLAELAQHAPHIQCDKYMKIVLQMPADETNKTNEDSKTSTITEPKE